MRMYEFSADDAVRFANFRQEKYIKRGDELQLERCPYCGGGKKENPLSGRAIAAEACKGEDAALQGAAVRVGGLLTLAAGTGGQRGNARGFQTLDYPVQKFFFGETCTVGDKI